MKYKKKHAENKQTNKHTNKQTREQTHHHTVRTVRKSNRKIAEKGKFDTLSTHIIDDHSLSSSLRTGTSIKSGVVKLVL